MLEWLTTNKYGPPPDRSNLVDVLRSGNCPSCKGTGRFVKGLSAMRSRWDDLWDFVLIMLPLMFVGATWLWFMYLALR